MKSTEIVKYTSGSLKNKKLINSLVLVVIFFKKNEYAETMIFFSCIKYSHKRIDRPLIKHGCHRYIHMNHKHIKKNMQLYNRQEELIKTIKTKSGTSNR